MLGIYLGFAHWCHNQSQVSGILGEMNRAGRWSGIQDLSHRGLPTVWGTLIPRQAVVCMPTTFLPERVPLVVWESMGSDSRCFLL